MFADANEIRRVSKEEIHRNMSRSIGTKYIRLTANEICDLWLRSMFAFQAHEINRNSLKLVEIC